MNLFAFFFLIGIVGTLQLPDLPGYWFSGSLVASGACIGAYSAFSRAGSTVWRIYAPLCLLSLGAGIGVSTHAVRVELGHQLNPSMEGVNVVIVGTVTGVPIIENRYSRFDLLVDSNDAAALEKTHTDFPPGKVRLSWYGNTKVLQPGQRWQLEVRVKKPRSYSNRGSFDYAGWLFQQRIHATGYVVDSSNNVLRSSVSDYQSSSRAGIAARVIKRAPNAENIGLMQGLLVGIRDRIPTDTWDVLRATGTSHLLAISGLHIGMLSVLGFFCGTQLWRWLGPTRLAAPYLLNRFDVSRIFAGLFAIGYAWLAGFTLPTQRALIMLGVVLIFQFSRRHTGSTLPLSVALCLVLLFDPLAPLSAGFWLSFSAVCALLILSRGRAGLDRGWRSGVRIHLALGALLFPLTSLFFGQGSLISPVANLLSIPYVSFFIVPPLMLWLFIDPISATLGSLCLSWVDVGLSLFIRGLELLVQWIPADVSLMDLSLYSHLAILTGLLLVFMPRVGMHRWLVLPLSVPFLWNNISPPAEPGLIVDVLDVGQGMSIVVRTPRHTLLYDIGGRFSANQSMASVVVVPFLRASGVRKIDRVILPRYLASDNQPIDRKREQPIALQALHEAFSVGHVVKPASEADSESISCGDDSGWVWDNVDFQMIDVAGSGSECILFIQWGDSRILLPGNINRTVERQLLSSLHQPDKSELMGSLSLLIAPNHGHQESSSRIFADKLRPLQVVYSVGYRNTSGFPHETVQMRYKKGGARQYRTDLDGALRFDFTETGLDTEPVRHRLNNRRLWHTALNPD